jgi:hypothetical protein
VSGRAQGKKIVAFLQRIVAFLQPFRNQGIKQNRIKLLKALDFSVYHHTASHLKLLILNTIRFTVSHNTLYVNLAYALKLLYFWCQNFFVGRRGGAHRGVGEKYFFVAPQKFSLGNGLYK